MTAELLDPTHPVATVIGSVRGELASVVGTPVWSMTTPETESALVEVARLEAQVTHLKLRLLAHADRVEAGASVGATSAANWFAHTTRTVRPAAHRAARLAARLEAAHPTVDGALADAAINLDQAQVIVEAVDALPADLVDAETRDKATAFLIHEARDHDAKALRILGRRLLEVAAPEAADAEEAHRLEAEEAAAQAAASFTMSDDSQGKCHGRFTMPSRYGSMLRKALLALAAPARHPDRPAELHTKHKLGLAFMEYIERHTTVPDAGGVAATVVVTLDLDTLMGGLKAAGLCDGTRISAGEARRMACLAGVIPVVLGGKSEPLDVGRKRRFHSKAQRLALGVRDGGCTAEGCDRPASMCQAHHDIPWSKGGSTDVKTGRLLCQRHHTLAHDRRYQHKAGPDGKVSFTRRM